MVQLFRCDVTWMWRVCVWSVWYLQQELLDLYTLNLHRIDKDVQRCDRNYWYFTPANLEKLRNIMCRWGAKTYMGVKLEFICNPWLWPMLSQSRARLPDPNTVILHNNTINYAITIIMTVVLFKPSWAQSQFWFCLFGHTLSTVTSGSI